MEKYKKYFFWISRFYWPYLIFGIILEVVLYFHFAEFFEEKYGLEKIVTPAHVGEATQLGMALLVVVAFAKLWLVIYIYKLIKNVIDRALIDDLNGIQTTELLVKISKFIALNYLLSLCLSIKNLVESGIKFNFERFERIEQAFAYIELQSATMYVQNAIDFFFPRFDGIAALILAGLTYLVAKFHRRKLDLETENRLTV